MPSKGLQLNINLLRVLNTLSWISNVTLLVLGCISWWRGLKHLNTADGVQCWLLTSYLCIFTLLMSFGHLGRPQSLLVYFHFLNTYLGRGLFQILVGLSITFLRKHFNLLTFICGVVTFALGLVEIFFSCPCFITEPIHDLDEVSFGYNSKKSVWGGRQAEREVSLHRLANPYTERRSIGDRSLHSYHDSYHDHQDPYQDTDRLLWTEEIDYSGPAYDLGR
eukprot:g65249.t1